MNTNCPHIDLAVKLLESEGNRILDISTWTKVKKVIQMRDGLSHNLKKKILSEIKELNHWKTNETLHNPGGEGFLCKKDNIAISFPTGK